MKTKNTSTGQKARASGAEFERRVRLDLEANGWFVAKWTNQVDLEKNKMVPAKPGFYKLAQTGWPDFVCLRKIENHWTIIGVEARVNGYITPTEKQKAIWYVNNGVFKEVLVAIKTKVKNKIQIKYKDIVDE